MEYSSKDYQPSESYCWTTGNVSLLILYYPLPISSGLSISGFLLLCPCFTQIVSCFLAQSCNILGLNLFCWDSLIQGRFNGPETFLTPTSWYSLRNSNGIWVLGCWRPHSDCWHHPSLSFKGKHLLSTSCRWGVRLGVQLESWGRLPWGPLRSAQAYSVESDMEPVAEQYNRCSPGGVCKTHGRSREACLALKSEEGHFMWISRGSHLVKGSSACPGNDQKFTLLKGKVPRGKCS